ncbi:MAG TPA: nucleoside triphosphate pyrophosphohydrolase, partial [Patescibacteria group bacterium]|nr:nucleoside triphosphate pyrophosphohydrolase [Patescibacteria group bacterium]
MASKKNPQPEVDQQMQKLLEVMARLRNPEGGCPWDLAQNFKTIVPYTIEEAYEVADAIEQNDMEELKAELGDLLFQVVYHAQMASEMGAFTFEEVVRGITEKMISRHPHVFGTGKAEKPEDVNVIWEARKDKEKKRQGAESILDDVPRALPALKRAQKLQNRAARVGFEWPEAVNVLDKLEEEIGEMREAIKGGRKHEVIDELGDLFFVLTNLGRMLGADCEDSLTHANNKFTRRFKGIESELKVRNVPLGQASLEEMEEIWQDQKKKEKQV